MRPISIMCASAALAALLGGLGGCSNELKVSEVEPHDGTYLGGEEVVIKGNGFQPGRGGVTVKFGKRDATAVVVASADRINVSTPAGDRNSTVDITVIFDDGKAFKLGNAFHYLDAAQNRNTFDKAFNQMGGKK